MSNRSYEVACVLNNMQSYISHPEFVKLKFVLQHGNTSRYDHSIRVMNKALQIAVKMPFRLDLNELAIATLLHDFHTMDVCECNKSRIWLARHHPEFASQNAKAVFNVTDRIYKAIRSHMFPLNIRFIPSSLFAFILGIADKICCIEERRSYKKAKICISAYKAQ